MLASMLVGVRVLELRRQSMAKSEAPVRSKQHPKMRRLSGTLSADSPSSAGSSTSFANRAFIERKYGAAARPPMRPNGDKAGFPQDHFRSHHIGCRARRENHTSRSARDRKLAAEVVPCRFMLHDKCTAAAQGWGATCSRHPSPLGQILQCIPRLRRLPAPPGHIVV